MRKIIFIASLVILLASAAYSQGVAEDKTTKKITELNKAGIDTIMVYQSFFPVVMHSDTSPCYIYNNPRYLVWVYQKHNFIAYVDECHDYNILKDKLDSVANLLAQHLSEIIQEDIKPPTFRIIYNGKERLDKLTTSDDAWFRYKFYVKGVSFVKSFSLSDLTTENYDGNKNIYYDENQRTYLKQVHDVLISAWPKLKFKKK